MIYNSTITSVNESDIMELLENAEDRFENYTIAEASAIVVAEQEANWTRFMKGVGFSELATIMEGQEVIYEGARLQSFLNKAKGYFKMALNKLAEITKSFIAKVDQFIRSNDGFLKKYEKDLLKMTVPADFEFKGYTFKNMGVAPEYAEPTSAVKITSAAMAKSVEAGSGDLSKEAAENELLPGTNSNDSVSDRLVEFFYGEKEKKELKNIDIKKQIEIIKNTKDDKKKAKDSYTKAAKRIKAFIKELEKGEREAVKSDKIDSKDGNAINEVYGKLITYWKAYSSCASQKHHAYMRALGARNKQAKAICTKLITTTGAAKGKEERAKIKAKMESGFVNTDAFLGAVEFI